MPRPARPDRRAAVRAEDGPETTNDAEMTPDASRFLFRVLIPATPPKEATKNWHGSWRTKAEAIAEARETGGWAVKKALTADEREGIPDALDLWITVVWPKGQRRFDDDGLIPAVAPFRDAIAEVLGHTSDHRYRVRSLMQLRVQDGEQPYTEIDVWTQEEAR